MEIVVGWRRSAEGILKENRLKIAERSQKTEKSIDSYSEEGFPEWAFSE